MARLAAATPPRTLRDARVPSSPQGSCDEAERGVKDRNDQRSPSPTESSSADGSWLAEVAQAAGREAGGVPVELLGDYLTLLADAATTGRKSDPVELPMVIRARDSAAVRAATEAVLHVVDAAVANLAEGYTEARKQMVRQEETLRREFIEDLLRGDADVGRLVERAEPFGLDMGRPHQVALAAPTGRLGHADAVISALERAVVHRFGDRDVLVAGKDGWIVVVAPADTDTAAPDSTGSKRSPGTTPPTPLNASPFTPQCSARDCSGGQTTI